MARRSTRNGILDWWQTVIDETKDFVDDRLHHCRGNDDELGEDIEGLKAAIAALDAQLDQLPFPATGTAPGRDEDSMTKAELQALADEHGIGGVDRTRQTRDQMLRLIRPAVHPSER